MNNNSIHDTKRYQIAETAIDIRTEQEPDINTDLYSAGWFDGLMGFSPELSHLRDYWDGYALGYREYCGDSHLLNDDANNLDYADKERIWREDLASLATENRVFS
jgi:hypothetical protein